MKKSRKHYRFLLLMVCLVSLLGCNRTRIIDKISIVHLFGFDQSDNGELIGTVLSPEYTKSKASDQIQYLSEQGETSALIVPKMEAYSNTPIEIAKIRVLIIGNRYAKAGIRNMVDRFVITPQLGTNIQIVASTHTAKETLNAFKKEKSLTLAEQLEHNMQGQNLPNMNLHYFLNHFYGAGMDPYVPMLAIDENEKLKIEGLGIFKDDQLKLRLNPEQSILFSILKDYRSEATLKMDLDQKNSKEIITVRAFRSKSHWDWNQKKKQLNLRLRLEWTLMQYPNRYNLEKDKDVREMKNMIVEKLEKEIRDLLALFKENEVDPLGLGNIVRSQDRTWKEEAFYQQYPEMPINVNINLQIIHTGLED
ncbi:Ger(x)C family spore germination protein [Bacillus tuaregi]|uniref:Ger(x)C family spore germination protein n=1 Tax=Bacillus tuaregi TaxID=1816695 RepID=UPI000A073A76|nr:Ger(x)C family spore germination protein [Bacillus tuaregi]